MDEFLRRIDARKRWSVSVSAAILPESNPARRTESEEVRVGNAPFRLGKDAQVVFRCGQARRRRRVVLACDRRRPAGIARGVGGGEALRPIGLERHIGIRRYRADAPVGPGQWMSGGLRLGRRWLGGDPDHRSLGPWGRMGRRLSGSTRLDVDVSALHRNHDTRGFLDGWRFSLRPGLRHTLDARTLIEVEPGLEIARARTPHNASRRIGFGATVSRAFEDGLTVSVSSAVHLRRYDEPHPLFARGRLDRGVRIGTRVLHRSVQYAGFAPYIGYSFERTGSNIEIYSYRNHGAILGVTRSF